MSNQQAYNKVATGSAAGTKVSGYGPNKVGEVTDLLKRAAYLPLFSMPNPEKPDVPLSPVPIITDLIPALRNFLLIGMYVFEAPHRFDVTVEEPSAERGLAASHNVGEQVAQIDVHFAITPKDFQAGPGRVPPPTLFLPFFSQRFSFPRGQFTYLDRQQSGFKGFGAGRTFPIKIDGQYHIRIGGIIQILEGLGKFKGLQGMVVVNGEIKPPNELALFMMPRIIDPNGILLADSPIEPIRKVPDPDPTTAFFFFLAEADRDHPITVNRAGNGRVISVNIFERLRLAHIGFDISTPEGIRSKTIEGQIVGSHRNTLVFNPDAPTEVTPLYSSNDVYTFYDKEGKTIGTLNANLAEGRAIRTKLAGAPSQTFRIGAAGPFLEGTGQFIGAIGMASVNGGLSLNPNAASSLYMLRVIDLDGRFRAATANAWS